MNRKQVKEKQERCNSRTPLEERSYDVYTLSPQNFKKNDVPAPGARVDQLRPAFLPVLSENATWQQRLTYLQHPVTQSLVEMSKHLQTTDYYCGKTFQKATSDKVQLLIHKRSSVTEFVQNGILKIESNGNES